MANIESVKLPNGSEYNIKDAISGYALQSEMSVTDGTGSDADKTTIQLKSGTSATVLKTHQSISGKADKVTGGTNGNLASLDSNGNLTDAGVALNISTPSNGQVMSYNGTSSKWENATMDLSNKVDKTDITSILATGATNTTGATITKGTYFYLDGVLCRAKADIAVNASFTLNTNYESVTVGNELMDRNSNSKDYTLSSSAVDISGYTSGSPYTAPSDGYAFVQARADTGNGVGQISLLSANNSGMCHIVVDGGTGQIENNSIFVRKGIKLSCAKTISTGTVNFQFIAIN